MKLIDVLRAAIAFTRDNDRRPTRITLNPNDFRDVVGAESFPREASIDTFLAPGAIGRASGLDWYEDACVPAGEIRLA